MSSALSIAPWTILSAATIFSAPLVHAIPVETGSLVARSPQSSSFGGGSSLSGSSSGCYPGSCMDSDGIVVPGVSDIDDSLIVPGGSDIDGLIIPDSSDDSTLQSDYVPTSEDLGLTDTSDPSISTYNPDGSIANSYPSAEDSGSENLSSVSVTPSASQSASVAQESGTAAVDDNTSTANVQEATQDDAENHEDNSSSGSGSSSSTNMGGKHTPTIALLVLGLAFSAIL